MARRNLLNNDNDITRPPMQGRDEESIIGGTTVPDDPDPKRQMETQPEFDIPARSRQNVRDAGPAPALFSNRKYEPTIIDDEVDAPMMDRNKGRNRRVVGWMVGVEGNCRGVDFRLHEGKNYIGRDERCEVYINDQKVSAGKVAQVVFDPRSKRFFSSDCDGTSTICYQNGEPLLGRNQISAYDSIELGDSKLLFVPLCGEHFTWSDGERDAD